MRNDPRSHGLWERTAPPAPDTEPLRGETATDVVVVGGGFTGLSAALHLAEAGIGAVVLEGVEIGFGGSGRNVGLVNAGMWVKPNDLPGILGPVHGERLLTLLGEAPGVVFDLIETHGIACEAQRSGTLHCAVGADGFRDIADRAAQWLARGVAVRVLDAAEARAKTGSDAYAGALLDPRAGTIQPLAYVRGLARAALAAGARIHAASPVVAADRHGTRWSVRTPGGTVTADWIIVATNAYTGTPWPEIRSELVRLPYFNIATAPLGANVAASILPERQGAWDTRLVMSSFRMDAAGRLVVGSLGALDGAGGGIHRAWARRALRRVFPRIGDVPFEAEWYGRIGMTGDHLPKFHRLAETVIGFSGYNGRGIAPGTVFGRVLARHIAGEIAEADLPLPLTDPRAQPFAAARAAVFEAGFQLAHLADARF